MVMARRDVGELLVQAKVISQEQLQQAREQQRTSGGALERALVELGFASETQVMEAKARLSGMRFVNLANVNVDMSAVNVVPGQLAVRHKVVPIAKTDQVLTVATLNPSDVICTDDLRNASGLRIQFVLATEDAIQDALNRYYAGAASNGASSESPVASAAADDGFSSSNFKDALAGYTPTGGQVLDEQAREDADLSNQAPIIRIAHGVIQQAVKDGASDIHVEPDRRGVRIRFRIDGVLQEVMSLPKHIHPPLVSRYKIMADMNIAERRVPQDGRIGITDKNTGKDYDLRVNCLPTLLGEKIVMRILDKGSVMIGLNKLGFYPDTMAQLETVITQPNGMVLSTGPTGAGKTTTQYSVLNKINSVEKNIMTIEDPVEYQLPGISQVAVHRKAGLTFATALRAFMRQDPDIIMVGEIRDLETAEMAIQASLTGHLVLSTLHTNDAPSSVTRMVDMGVEPFLVSATLIAAMAQRLGRRICANCTEPYEVEAHTLRRLGFTPEDEDQMVTLQRGKGCEICRHRGYKGRIGIYEMMMLNEEIAELIVRRAPLGDVREAARANGMKTLQEDGLRKVLDGITTPEEVQRVVFTGGH